LVRIKIIDPTAALRKADRGECFEFALLALTMTVLLVVTYAVSAFVHASVGFYLVIAFIAAACCVYRAQDAWRHSQLPSRERRLIEERRAVRRKELEEQAESRPSSWAERIAKSEG
jgi:hypothetical protein